MSERSDQKRPLPPAILADALQDRPSMPSPDVTAQAFREAAHSVGLVGVNSRIQEQIEQLLLAAAEQREQLDAVQRNYDEARKRLADCRYRIKQLTEENADVRRIGAALTTELERVTAERDKTVTVLTHERDDARAQFAQAVERLEAELERAMKGRADDEYPD